MKDFDVILEKEIKEVDNAYHKYEFGEFRTLMTIQMGYDPETATEEEKIKAEPYEKDIKIIMGRMNYLFNGLYLVILFSSKVFKACSTHLSSCVFL